MARGNEVSALSSSSSSSMNATAAALNAVGLSAAPSSSPSQSSASASASASASSSASSSSSIRVRPVATGGRPATMTRRAVVQARSTQQQQPPPWPIPVELSATATDGDQEGEDGADGWVNVDHRRRHRNSARSTTTTSTTTTTTVRGKTGKDRALRRTQSMHDGATLSVEVTGGAGGDDAPTNARAAALSAAVTMDKKTRERRYAGPMTSTASPPRSPPLMRSASSLSRLMSSWQAAVATVENGGDSQVPSAHSARSQSAAEADAMTSLSLPPPPATSGLLRRTQSDATQLRTEKRRGRSPTDGRRSLLALIEDHRTLAAASSASPPESTGDAEAGISTEKGNGNAGSTSAGGGQAQRKCGDKRDFFFRNLEYETRSQLMIDDVAAFSVTDFEMAKKISLAILALFPSTDNDLASGMMATPQRDLASMPSSPTTKPTRKSPLVITDGTACVGGNVLSFCEYFSHVHAVENDAIRVQMLEHNLRVLGRENVSCRLASYLDIMLELKQDVVFIDPPWGGPEYKERERVDLFLDERPLYEICEALRGHVQCVVLKVPTNFDDQHFAAHVSGNVVVRRDFKKMHLVILDFRPIPLEPL